MPIWHGGDLSAISWSFITAIISKTCITHKCHQLQKNSVARTVLNKNRHSSFFEKKRKIFLRQCKGHALESMWRRVKVHATGSVPGRVKSTSLPVHERVTILGGGGAVTSTTKNVQACLPCYTHGWWVGAFGPRDGYRIPDHLITLKIPDVVDSGPASSGASNAW